MNFSEQTPENVKEFQKTNLSIFQTLNKKSFLFFSLLFTSISFYSIAQTSPAMLDVSAANKGILIPRVSLTSNLDILTVPSPVVSLMVYNTSSAGNYPNRVSPNFYFWDGNKWKTLGGPMAYSEFFALMPGDNTATIAAGAAINFPQDGISDGIITRSSANEFLLPAVGIYIVDWQVSISEAAQIMIALNGVEMPNTVVGRATGTSQVTGHTMINTTVANSLLSIVNPSGNPAALTITTIAGGNRAVSANLVITRIQ
jgi:hypothetical protein